MAQSGFAFFFLAVIAGCIFGVARWVQLNWQRIASAVRGETAQPRPVNYRAVQLRPIDVPYVAQRMLADRPGGLRLAAAPAPIRASHLAAPRVHQLGFGF